jgi:bacterioferritin B
MSESHANRRIATTSVNAASLPLSLCMLPQSAQRQTMADRLEKDKELVMKSERQIEGACGLSVQTFTPDLSRLRLFSQLQSPVVGERVLSMVVNGKIIAAINEQMGNEFSAMLQYYAIAAHFGAEGLRELSAYFYRQAEEEKEHALRFIQFVIDTGARVRIPAVSAPQAHFEVAEDAVKLSLEQEEEVTIQINTLMSMAKAESDYTTDNFLQWFIKEQLEEVASMGQLLRVVQRAGEGNLLRVEEYLARERDSGGDLSEEE